MTVLAITIVNFEWQIERGENFIGKHGERSYLDDDDLKIKKIYG